MNLTFHCTGCLRRAMHVCQIKEEEGAKKQIWYTHTQIHIRTKLSVTASNLRVIWLCVKSENFENISRLLSLHLIYIECYYTFFNGISTFFAILFSFARFRATDFVKERVFPHKQCNDVVWTLKKVHVNAPYIHVPFMSFVIIEKSMLHIDGIFFDWPTSTGCIVCRANSKRQENNKSKHISTYCDIFFVPSAAHVKYARLHQSKTDGEQIQPKIATTIKQKRNRTEKFQFSVWMIFGHWICM